MDRWTFERAFFVYLVAILIVANVALAIISWADPTRLADTFDYYLIALLVLAPSTTGLIGFIVGDFGPK
jgi:hypothetical protein